LHNNITMLELPSPTDIQAGVDEAGLGCLYGPCVAAAVVLPREYHDEYENIRDSKKLTAEKRAQLSKFIKETAITYGIGISSVQEIDTHNILQANYLAMHRALEQVCEIVEIDEILIDGNRFKQFHEIRHKCIVKGDDKHLSIAAASILAKHHRDQLILEAVEENPMLKEYGIHKNKGYGSAQHLAAIKKLGIIEGGHRTSYGPCGRSK